MDVARGLPRPGSARRRCPTKLTASLTGTVAKAARDPAETACRSYGAKTGCRYRIIAPGWRQPQGWASPRPARGGRIGAANRSRVLFGKDPWVVLSELSTPGVLEMLRNSSFGPP